MLRRPTRGTGELRTRARDDRSAWRPRLRRGDAFSRPFLTAHPVLGRRRHSPHAAQITRAAHLARAARRRRALAMEPLRDCLSRNPVSDPAREQRARAGVPGRGSRPLKRRHVDGGAQLQIGERAPVRAARIMHSTRDGGGGEEGGGGGGAPCGSLMITLGLLPQLEWREHLHLVHAEAMEDGGARALEEVR